MAKRKSNRAARITPEKLQEIYEAAVHEEATGDQDADFDLHVILDYEGGTGATIRKLIDMVRAANREAQPVALVDRRPAARGSICWQSGGKDLPHGTALFTAPPAPAYPETLPCAVRLMPGIIFGEGVRTSTMLDGLRRREEYNAEMAAMTPEQKAEHDAGHEAFKAMLLSRSTPAPAASANVQPVGYLVAGYKEDFEWGPANLFPEPGGGADIPVYLAAPAVVIPDKVSCEGFNPKDWVEARNLGQREGWNAYRAAMLAATPPAQRDGYCLMPLNLTAENGAKYALSGEFKVSRTVTCNECGGDGCNDCGDAGEFEEEITVPWDTIKEIYRAAVGVCAQPNAAPKGGN